MKPFARRLSEETRGGDGLPGPRIADPAANAGDQRAPGHLGEFGQIVPQGEANAARLIAIVEDPDSGLPADAIATLTAPVGALTHLETEIGKLDAEISRRARERLPGT